ncbi:germination protein YpeB [Caldicellulosiruptor acetigenus]|uniref:germination protein YpeB n=1 Tax=Caldicellulosiruptor acetigenus TaxID=301953 RepID=UPI0003FF0B16|nr:germination protein YpeB [Caldicellulosiruptor acetigenus]WAM37112.1 germination protein YpeB [Caldicellulosiruptor acetigenus]
MSILGGYKELRERLKSVRLWSVMAVTLGILVIVALWGVNQYRGKANYHNYLTNMWHRAFFDMVGYVQNIQALLSKAEVSGDDRQRAVLYTEVWRNAFAAQENLSQLPIENNVALERTAKYLTQVGDLSFSLSKQLMSGKKETLLQRQQLKKLRAYADKLSSNLNELAIEISQGRLRWGEVRVVGTSRFRRIAQNVTSSRMLAVEAGFKDYPTLIYDGPFSDHISRQTPKGLPEKLISKEQAKKIALDFLNLKRADIVNYLGLSGDRIKVYTFEIIPDRRIRDRTITIAISKKGGKVIWMIDNRASSSPKIGVAKAKENAKKFLLEKGFANMIDTFYLKQDNTALINYILLQNGVKIYPDMVKVRVALDTGQIVGFDATAYYMSHTSRKIPKPAISERQARNFISKNFDVQSVSLAIIPLDSGKEVFTYEFLGKYDGKYFADYINAITGKEENILEIIKDPNGILSM